MVLILSFAACLPCFAQLEAGENKNSHTKVIKLMGSRFEITAQNPDAQSAWDAINAAIAEISRIESLISSWDTNSQTSLINKNAGIRAIKVERELYDLIARSLKISRLTEGAFDISFASIDKLWRFDGSMTQMPPADAVKQSVNKINHRNIILDNEASSVFLREKGMKIGFGAIGKGYAANRAKFIMQSMGIESGVVNAGGDLIGWGKLTDGSQRRIAISDPNEKEHILSWLSVEDMAVVTSGDYERYVIFDGKRYAHIIDPRTGYPVTGLKSVTIICPDAELADALATSVFVLGEKKGLELINQLKGIECLLVTDENEIKTSTNLQLNPYLEE